MPVRNLRLLIASGALAVAAPVILAAQDFPVFARTPVLAKVTLTPGVLDLQLGDSTMVAARAFDSTGAEIRSLTRD